MLDFPESATTYQNPLVTKAGARRLGRITRRQLNHFVDHGPLQIVRNGTRTYVTRASLQHLIDLLNARDAPQT